MSVDFCTIVSKNYLAYARALGESIRRHHPESRFFVCLADRVDEAFDPAKEPFTLIEAEDLGIEDFNRFAFGYSVIEINTAVKPWVLGKLFHGFDAQKVVYLDPDILLFDNLEPVVRALDHHEIVLTPHLTTPYDDDSHPDEIDILRAGTYNLGFIGLKRSATADRLIRWWRARLYDGCRMDPDEGYHVDQKWIDLVPGLFENVHVSREKGLNVAYWNLHDRPVRFVDERPMVDERPLYFFHFSGFDPRLPEKISKHQNRFTMEEIGEAAPLYAHYAERLLAHGYLDTNELPYAYANFDNGEVIPADLRRGYLVMRDGVRPMGNPFATAGKKSLYAWWGNEREKYKKEAEITVRPTLSRGFDVERGWLGVNLSGYFRAETGVGEVVRGMAHALQSARVPLALNAVWDDTAENAVEDFTTFDEGNPHPTNLVHVNADAIAGSFDQFQHYLRDHHNIGYWCWEQSDFPGRWRECFDLFDTIWTLSSFGRDAIAKVSPVPVRVVPPPVAPLPDRMVTREELGLPADRFLFLFAFDYHSFFERKNPLGVVRAFRQAFGDDPRVQLVIKAARPKKYPREAERLRAACRGLPNVRLIEAVWSRERTHALVGICDAYVSLHRSEGFGFLLAEAMSLGKPVIATAYSGNLDFMNTGNSLLCRYGLTELTHDHGPYPKGSCWAEPDLEHAATLMRQLVGDATLVKRLGARAAREIGSSLSHDAVGARALAELRRTLAMPRLPKRGARPYPMASSETLLS